MITYLEWKVTDELSPLEVHYQILKELVFMNFEELLDQKTLLAMPGFLWHYNSHKTHEL